MNILVLSQAYPSYENKYAMGYVHTRCVKYRELGHNVTVLSFSASIKYNYEDVLVCPSVEDFYQYDLIVSHAPNVKNHMRTLLALKGHRVVVFFHGHEVLKTYSDYPAPFFWKNSNLLKRKFVGVYDYLKLKLMGLWLKHLSKHNKLGLVFVSRWMREQFERNIGVPANIFGNVDIIENAVNDCFAKEHYFPNENLSADFLTIRPLDESKYALDVVLKFAEANPGKTFHIYGRGDFFKYYSMPSNVEWFDRYLSQKEIPKLLNNYTAVLMPTRYDAQGVMVCEMATYGIPVITSNISVCQEMLNDFVNVSFIDNLSLDFSIEIPTPVSEKNKRFFSDELINRELVFFDGL